MDDRAVLECAGGVHGFGDGFHSDGQVRYAQAGVSGDVHLRRYRGVFQLQSRRAGDAYGRHARRGMETDRRVLRDRRGLRAGTVPLRAVG